MVNQVKTVKVKLRKLSSRSVSIYKFSGFNREDSTQCYNSKTESELEQLKQVKNVKVKLRKLSSRSVSIYKPSGFSREDSTQCYNSKSESELEQLNNTN
jgi:predicted nucleic acid-binding Zn ribbon protein